jgi:hypothetical protein
MDKHGHKIGDIVKIKAPQEVIPFATLYWTQADALFSERQKLKAPFLIVGKTRFLWL